MSIEAPVKRPCSGFIIVQIYFNPVEDLWHFLIEEVCTICNLYFGSSQNSATVDFADVWRLSTWSRHCAMTY